MKKLFAWLFGKNSTRIQPVFPNDVVVPPPVKASTTPKVRDLPAKRAADPKTTPPRREPDRSSTTDTGNDDIALGIVIGASFIEPYTPPSSSDDFSGGGDW